MTLIELARKLRPYIEKAAISLSDEDALESARDEITSIIS